MAASDVSGALSGCAAGYHTRAMAPLRPVSAEEIESLAIGAWILGTGGGGSPYLALLNMRTLYRQGAVVSLMDPADLADDDLVAVVSNMGAPLVGQERLTDPRTISRINWMPPFGGYVHTAMPLPSRGLVIGVCESVKDTCEEDGDKRVWVIDVRNERQPVTISSVINPPSK